MDNVHTYGPGTFAVSEKARASGKVLTRVAWYVAFGALLGLLVLLATLTLAGYRLYTVGSGSMEPSLPTGSVAVTQTVDANALDIGDIVVRPARSDMPAILHRIVGIGLVEGQTYFTTQGDANSIPDEEPLAFEGGEGQKVVYAVSDVGHILSFAASLTGRLVLIGIPALLLFATSVPGNGILRRIVRLVPLPPEHGSG